MTLGITRAADRVAIWHEAINDPDYMEEKYVTKPPTSTPPSGVTPPEPSTAAPEPVVVPQSNKFKYPASALKKILDTKTTGPNTGPPHNSAHLKEWFNTHQDFAKSYVKPQYNEALKAHLGEEAHAKLLYHMPKEHHEKLTTHTQQPGPKSNKFKYPTNTLKKLLDDPKTTPEHLQTWKDKNPGYVKSYLHNPAYQQAIKNDVGAKNYDDWQEHLAPGNKPAAPPSKADDTDEYIKQLKEVGYPKGPAAPPTPSAATPTGLGDKLHAVNPKFDPEEWNHANPEVAQAALQKYVHGDEGFEGFQSPELHQVYQEHFGQPEKPAVGKPSADDVYHQKLLDAAEAHPDVTGEQMKMFKSPEFQDWFKSKGVLSQKAWAQDPASAVGYYQQDTGFNVEDLPGPSGPGQYEFEGLEPAVGNEPAAESHPGGNKPAIDKGALNQDLFDAGLPGGFLTGLSPEDAEAKIKESIQQYEGTETGEKLKAIHTTHFPSWGAQDPTPEAELEATSPGEAEQHKTLTDAIAKIFPNSTIAQFPDESTVPEIKKQLENWLTHLDHPEHVPHVKQLKDLYDQHFGEGAAQIAPSPEQPPASSGKPGLIEDFRSVFPTADPFTVGDLKGKTPEEQKKYLQDLVPLYQEGGQWHDEEQLGQLNALLDKHFGQPSAPSGMSPAFQSWYSEQIDNTPGAWESESAEDKKNLINQFQQHQQPFAPSAKPTPSWLDPADARAWEAYEQLPGEDPGDPAELKADFEDWNEHYGPGAQGGPTDDQNLKDLADVMGSYQGGSKYLTDVPDYKAWEKSLSKQQAQDFLNDPQAAKQHFEEFLTKYDYSGDVSPEDQDEIAKIQQELGGDPWATKPEPSPLADWEQELLEGGGVPAAAGVHPDLPGGVSGNPVTMKADFEKIVPGHKWKFSSPDDIETFKDIVGDVLQPDYDLEGDNIISTPHQVDLLKQFWAKHFGEGGGGGAPAGYDGPPLAWIKKHYPNVSLVDKGEAGVQQWWEQHKNTAPDEAPAAAQAWMEDHYGDKAEHGGGVPDGGAQAPAGAQTVGEKLKALKPDMPPTAEQLDAKLEGKSPEQIKNLFDSTINGNPDIADGLQKIYDQHYGGGAPAPPPLPEFDWDEFGPEFKGLFTSSSWADSVHTPEEAEAKLKALVDKSNEQHPDSDKTKAANELYTKWFGATPAVTPAGGGNQPAQPPQYQEPPPPPPEPEEEEGVSAPAKSEQPDEEVLAALTGATGEEPVKATTPSDWKDFAAWWGKTILSPEQEQAIYQAWFPGKQVTPEKANSWFQQIYDHYSKPSTGDLTAAGMPAWATASWALGTKAEKEWPVFQQWAAKDAGIPKGTSVKQKLGIWNGLNAADKKEIAENYLPATPVDTKAVVGALAQAFPDSDFSKWAKMPQGTLKTNVEMLAKSGYDEAIPVYNQFFGGTLPVPEAAAEKGNKPAAPWEPPMIPPSALPDWVNYHWGDSDAEAKKYTDFKHFADSIGAGDLVEQDYQGPLVKMWQQLPTYQQQQITSMPTPPWKDANEFTAWKDAQPKLIDHLKQLYPEQDWESGYGLSYTFNKATVANSATMQRKKLGDMIEAEPDPQKKQELLGLYHQYFGNGKTTLAQSLSAIYPNEDWDKFLKGKDLAGVQKELKKRLKAEKDPERWVQLIDTWTKYFPHPTSNYKVAPPGIKAVTNFMSNTSPGNGINPSYLKALKYWKEVKGGDPNVDVPYYHYIDADYDPGPYIASKQATKDPGGYPAYHGWTPAGQAAMEGFKADPAMLGSSGPTYTAPAAEAKGKQYETLMETAGKHKADSHAGGGLSAKELGVLKSEEFAHWWSRASKGYQNVYKTHPGIALDDFREFMGGGAPYSQVPAGGGGPEKYLDVSPFANVPKKAPGLPSTLTYNPQRAESIKFPRHEPTPGQETLPLGPGQQWAPGYAPMPIYRVMKLPLDQDPQIPSSITDPKKREVFRQQQKARLRRIDEIINGTPKATTSEHDYKKLKSWGSSHGVSDQEITELAAELFAEQPTLFDTDEKWQHLKDWAKQHGHSAQDMYDLADKLEVLHPGETTGNYEHPELGQLITDYIEGNGGMGIHWTRDIDKLYNGISAAGISKDDMRGRKDYTPVLVSGWWGGQGEGSGQGGAYPALDTRELEHNLLSGAPVHVFRVQVRDPNQDWHDTMDYGPISLWPPGRNETASGKKDYDEPSLAVELGKITGQAFSANEWDRLVPGHDAEAKFRDLIATLPNDAAGQKKAADLGYLYQKFFIGRPEKSLKPHVRHAATFARFTLANVEDRIERLAAALAEEKTKKKAFDPGEWPDWIDEYDYDQQDTYNNWVKYFTPEQVKHYNLFPDALQDDFDTHLNLYDEGDYDESWDETDWRNPPGPAEPEHVTMGRPEIPRDPRSRRFFSPRGLNPESTSSARPETEWETAEPEQEMLPGHEWPPERQTMPVYRGLMLDLSRKDLGHVRRALLGGEYEKGEGSLTSDKAIAQAHPLGYDNPALGEHILNHIQNNPRAYGGSNSGLYGIGPHWSIDPSTAQSFATEHHVGNPLQLPVMVKAHWKGLGEDPYRTNTQGDWPEESEVTMLPGAKMSIDSVQIKHPKTKNWHEVLDVPSERAASVVRKPRGILTVRERLGL